MTVPKAEDLPEILNQAELPKFIANIEESLKPEIKDQTSNKESVEPPPKIEVVQNETEKQQVETTAIQNINQDSNKCRRYLEAARKRCCII